MRLKVKVSVNENVMKISFKFDWGDGIEICRGVWDIGDYMYCFIGNYMLCVYVWIMCNISMLFVIVNIFVFMLVFIFENVIL